MISTDSLPLFCLASMHDFKSSEDEWRQSILHGFTCETSHHRFVRSLSQYSSPLLQSVDFVHIFVPLSRWCMPWVCFSVIQTLSEVITCVTLQPCLLVTFSTELKDRPYLLTCQRICGILEVSDDTFVTGVACHPTPEWH